MPKRVAGASHLRLVGGRDDERIRAIASRLEETPLDERARAIADAIAEEVGDLRAAQWMAPPRVELALHVGLVAEGEHWVGFTQTADRRSICVTTYLTRPIGTDVELLIELPGGGVVEAVGVVAGIRTPQAGSHALPGLDLRLVSMSSHGARAWADLIELTSGQFWATSPVAIDA